MTVVSRCADEGDTQETSETNINAIPEVVQAITNAVLNEDAANDDKSTTITDMSDWVDYIDQSCQTSCIYLYGTCQACAMRAYGRLDRYTVFYCQRCWQLYCPLS